MNKIKIISEIGVNHNGQIKIAKKLIYISKKCGAKFVKFQMFDVDDHILPSSKLAKYQKKNINSKSHSQYSMAKKYQLSLEDFKYLNNY